jgi:hypothetical protein
MWHAYNTKWSTVTRDRLNPNLMERVPELRVPPASVIDRMQIVWFSRQVSRRHSYHKRRRDRCLRPVDRAFRRRLWPRHHPRRSAVQFIERKPRCDSRPLRFDIPVGVADVEHILGLWPKTAGTRFRDASSEARTRTPAHGDVLATFTRPGPGNHAWNLASCSAFAT